MAIAEVEDQAGYRPKDFDQAEHLGTVGILQSAPVRRHRKSFSTLILCAKHFTEGRQTLQARPTTLGVAVQQLPY